MAKVTGIGAVSSLGRGIGPLWSAMAEGRDGIAPIKRFSTTQIGVDLGAMVPDRNAPAHAAASPVSCLDFAVAAAREAWTTAGLDRVARDRIALVFGSSLGDTDVEIYRVTEQLGDALGIAGPRLTVTTACASSTNAIGLGLELLRLGVADAVIAGGADVLTPLVLAGFHALGVLAEGKCAPFSEPAGTTLGEGAGFLVLEPASSGTGVLGYGLSADAFHDTGPDPSGAGVARALRDALADAGIEAGAIDYVNAHGTGTRANDPAEWRAIQHVLGDRAKTVPVSSSKSFLGHAQGAAGVLETIATLVALERRTIPPTQRYRGPRPQSPVDAVGQDTARPASCRFALSNSAGFGGTNCALVLGPVEDGIGPRRPVTIEGSSAIGPHGPVEDRSRIRRPVTIEGSSAIGPHGTDRALVPDRATVARPVTIEGSSAIGPHGPVEDRSRIRRPVTIEGYAAIGPHGTTVDALVGSSAVGRVSGLDFEARFPAIDPRGLDTVTRYLIAAVSLALEHGKLRLHGRARDRSGLVVGTTAASIESTRALYATIASHGYRGLSANLFARQVVNAAPGTCARLLGLRGPHSVIAAGEATGLAAILYAAQLVATRPEVDQIVAGGLDELPPEEVSGSEGAAFVIVGAGTGPRIAGWSIAGPGKLEYAVRAACTMAGVEQNELSDIRTSGSYVSGQISSDLDSLRGWSVTPVVRLPALAATGPAFASAAQVVLGARLIQRGDARAVVIAQHGGASADCALVLTGGS